MRKFVVLFAAALLALSLLSVSVAAQASPSPTAGAATASVVATSPSAAAAPAATVSAGASPAPTGGRKPGQEARERAGREAIRKKLQEFEDRFRAAAERSKEEREVSEECLGAVRALRGKVQSASKDVIRGELKGIQEKCKRARERVRGRLNRKHIDGINGLEHRMRELNRRTDIAIAHLEARGVDVSGVKGKLNECKANLDTAKAKIQQAQQLIPQLATATEPATVNSQIHGFVSQARDNVKAARDCYRDLLKQLREKAKEARGKPVVKPVVTPTPVPAEATSTPAASGPTATAVPTATSSPKPSP